MVTAIGDMFPKRNREVGKICQSCSLRVVKARLEKRVVKEILGKRVVKERLENFGSHENSVRAYKERLEKKVVQEKLKNSKHEEKLKKRFRDEEERLGKRRRQEKSKDGEAKSRQQLREREREAARIRLLKMENTADMELNYESYRELETLSGCSLASFVFLETQEKSRVMSAAFQGSHFWNPLEKLGLRLKDDDCCDDVDNVIREGDRSKVSCHVHVIGKEESKKSSLEYEKYLRAAMLRRRYAKIIFKSQQKTLFC